MCATVLFWVPLLLAQAEPEGTCTQQRVIGCSNIFTATVQCGQGEMGQGECVADDDECRSRVAYAICLRGLGCEPELYEIVFVTRADLEFVFGNASWRTNMFVR